MIAWWLGVMMAFAGGSRVVLDGETVETIAADLGDEKFAKELRKHNGIAKEDQPKVGTVLRVPDGIDGASCGPSYVVSHHGKGTIVPPGSPPEPIRAFAPLVMGAKVCTQANSFARLHLATAVDTAEHDTVTLMPNSCLTIRATHTFGGRRSAHVELQAGTISVANDEADAHLVVETDAGVTVGENGGYRVTVEKKGGAMRTEAVSGGAVTTAQGVQVDLAAGYGNRTEKGEAPGEAVALPDPGQPIAPLHDAILRVPDFSWSPAPAAFGYIVEIARGEGFEELVLRQSFGDPAWAPPYLLLPEQSEGLWWRITTFDLAGFEGVPSEARRFLLPQGGE